MASRFMMDYKLQELSNNTKSTKFGVRTKKLCKLQSIEAVHRSEPEEQQTKMLRVRRNEGRATHQHVQPILAILEDQYKGGHVLGLNDGREMTKLALWGWRSNL